MSIYDIFNIDIGIDLGTANTLIVKSDKKILLREPTVVAIETDTERVIEVGESARKMIGKTPYSIKAIRPLKEGVIADFSVTEKMIKHFINRCVGNMFLRSVNVVICVPSGVTEVEKKAVMEATKSAGAKKVLIVEEPVVAAIGAGIDISEAKGNMVIDIGGGTTEIAVISYGGIVLSRSTRIGGDAFDEAIVQYIRKEYSITVGEVTAEEIKKTIGCAYKTKDEIKMEVSGRDLLTGLPKTFSFSSYEVLEALKESLNNIVDSVKYALEKTPPELASDIIDNGICLTGGGALLRGMDTLISSETNVSVNVAENPLDSVAMGTGIIAKELRNYSKNNKGK